MSATHNHISQQAVKLDVQLGVALKLLLHWEQN